MDERLRRALTQHMKFTHMTVVQDATVRDIVAGHDMLAKARTGTGKTVAFLLPSLDRLVRWVPTAGPTRRDISILVLSRTR